MLAIEERTGIAAGEKTGNYLILAVIRQGIYDLQERFFLIYESALVNFKFLSTTK
jgi:hypothetical protein